MKIQRPRPASADFVDRLRSRRNDERGSSAVEMAIIFPVTVFVVFGIIQFGLWYHAAGHRPLRRPGRRPGGQRLPGHRRGRLGRRRAGLARERQRPDHPRPGRPLPRQQVATVTVSGQALQVIPFIPLARHAVGHRPRRGVPAATAIMNPPRRPTNERRIDGRRDGHPHRPAGRDPALLGRAGPVLRRPQPGQRGRPRRRPGSLHLPHPGGRHHPRPTRSPTPT